MVDGTPSSASARVMALTAPPSETPGARSKPMVAAGNCSSCMIESGVVPRDTVAKALSGTWAEVLEEVPVDAVVVAVCVLELPEATEVPLPEFVLLVLLAVEVFELAALLLTTLPGK